jgi:hypothetical protein
MYKDALSTKSDRIDIEEKDYFSGFVSRAFIPSTSTAYPLRAIPIFNLSFPLQPTVIEKDEDQSWYWTDAWQEMERKAEEDMRKGNYETFNSMDDFIATLDA